MTAQCRCITIVTVVVALLAATPVASAQRVDKVWRIGYLGIRPLTTPEQVHIFDAFRQGLRELGYDEGRNLVIDTRFTEGRTEQLPKLAADLVRLKVDVIAAAGGLGAIRAAKEATSSIPIVMLGASDPVESGLVSSLARPGGNVTGIASLQTALTPKRLQVLKEIVPGGIRIVHLYGDVGGFSPTMLAEMTVQLTTAARLLSLTLLGVQMKTPGDFDDATTAILRERPDALLVAPNATNFVLRAEIAQFAARHRLPSMVGVREGVTAGCLVSYGPDAADMFRKAGIYVAKILNGARAAELPVEQPTKFNLVVNLKTARTLGLTIPPSLLVRADEVLE